MRLQGDESLGIIISLEGNKGNILLKEYELMDDVQALGIPMIIGVFIEAYHIESLQEVQHQLIVTNDKSNAK